MVESVLVLHDPLYLFGLFAHDHSVPNGVGLEDKGRVSNLLYYSEMWIDLGDGFPVCVVVNKPERVPQYSAGHTTGQSKLARSQVYSVGHSNVQLSDGPVEVVCDGGLPFGLVCCFVDVDVDVCVFAASQVVRMMCGVSVHGTIGLCMYLLFGVSE